ncbi:hypothetical protein BDY19DRAFT_989278 [Irpex rosettiformis]|uniref:Uncharacterized protein n=1 Tax=Irpex rosettiformis TaxID=378272 RepID=A0ACB8UHR9_9APHY|nr:hypothetical protein BDY19DRAFT_989278 [Irpex rosettiformis]
MSEEEAEYEVEYISRAQVVKLGKKTAWKFEVKWKNYDIDANTWEPISSFKGSEHFINSFWTHTPEKRDWRNLKQFKAGEWIYRVGPPRAGSKGKGKSKVASTSRQEPSTSKRSKDDVSEDEVIEDSEPEILTAKTLSESYPSTKKRRASVVEDVEEVLPNKRRRDRSAKSARLDVGEPESASRGPELHKTKSISKLPRIPAVKSKRKLTEPSSASKSTAAATQGTSQRKSTRRLPAISKESSPDVLIIDPPPIADDTSSEADRELVIESLDVHSSGSRDHGDLFGDSNGDVIMEDDTPPAVQQAADAPSSMAPVPTFEVKIPAHRAKEANPRIKMMDDGFTSQSGLSVKAALARPLASGSSNRRQSVLSRGRPSESRAIMGSTSLLTAGRNGGLVTVRKHVEPVLAPSPKEPSPATGLNNPDIAGDVEPVPSEVVADVTPVTGKEVLQLAGLEAGASEALPDFEDTTDLDAEGESDHDAEHQEGISIMIPIYESGVANGTVIETNGTLAHEEPTVIIPKPLANSPIALIGQSGANVIPSTLSAWKRTTIFGPLSSRSTQPTRDEGPSTSQGASESTSFLVVLGPTVDLPVVLKDIHPSKAPSLKSLDLILNSTDRGVPGRFYKGGNATAIVDSFGVEGSSARVVLKNDVTEVQMQNFERFKNLLKEGVIFVVMVSAHLLAFSSSENVEISSKLGISPNLVGLGDNILVTEVVIQNDLMYVDATMNAEDERW